MGQVQWMEGSKFRPGESKIRLVGPCNITESQSETFIWDIQNVQIIFAISVSVVDPKRIQTLHSVKMHKLKIKVFCKTMN